MADENEDDGPIALAEEVKCPEGAPEWVVTFGDMMSLLLTFFILLLSFAEMQIIKYKVMASSVMQAFGVQEVTPVFARPQGSKIVPKQFNMSFNMTDMMDGMKTAAERQAARAPSGRVDIEVYEDYRGIVVSLDEEAMFERGRSDLRPAVWPFLDDVLSVAINNDAQIQVEAHTDSLPIKTARYPSNDHLSAARSVSVIRYFVGVEPELETSRLEAVPFGDVRPLTVNLNESARRRNRRVELVFYAKPKDWRAKD